MKRVYILLLLLVVLGGVVFLMEDQKSAIIMPTPAPVQNTNVLSGTDAVSGDQIAIGSGAIQTGGRIDDTELPLDQNAQAISGIQQVQVIDPEVEEIIDLLEELIAESESAQ